MVDQIDPYTQWWNERNQEALHETGPLMVVIGDSSALGIGASHPGRSYVGRLAAALSMPQLNNVKDDADHRLTPGRTGQPWRVINLSQSGAKFEDGLSRQVPIAEQLPGIDLLLCCLGTNDLVWGLNTASLNKKATQLVTTVRMLSAPKKPGVVCSVAGGSPRARMVNRTLKTAVGRNNAEASEGGFLISVNPWTEPGPRYSSRLAADRFHLNDLGYSLMSTAVGRSLGIESGEAEWVKVDGHPV